MRAGRYEIREVLGEGGMGVVYRAWDPVLNGDVSLKTIRDPQNKQALDLFERERAILASISHPNIVTILHLGDTEDGGVNRPYFVMPLLRGATLQNIIEDSSVRLTVERSIHIVTQVCRGLQAAHDHGIVHRDIKPSNIFVLPDDSVVIIDFGMAHFSNHRSTTGMKGTPSYMAPEQVAMKQPTPQSDQFSLAVVCYQLLARRHPFFAPNQDDLRQAITSLIPQPISKFNPVVNPGICQVVHRALAKDPVHRYSNVREFAELLQKALRGETIEALGSSRVSARLHEAKMALEMGDLDEAEEIAGELAAQSLDAEVADFRKFLYEKRRSAIITQLLEKARKHFDQGNYTRALKHVQEVLDLDPDNTDAFTLKGAIGGKRNETQISDWYQLATEHVDNRSFQNARDALEKVLEIRPNDVRAKLLLSEVERQEQEHSRLREEHQKAYDSAMESYKRGDLNSAVRKLEHVLDVDRRAGHRIFQDQGVACQQFYEEVRTKRDQLTSKDSEARRHIQNGNLAAAGAVVQEVLAAFPDNVLFKVLHDDILVAERQELSAFQAKVEKDVASEPDFGQKVFLLEEARKRYPAEVRFQQALQQVRSRRDLLDSIAGQARTLEEQRQFSDALGKWETMRSIHPQYPGLEIEIDRLRRRREQQARSDLKAHRIAQVDQALAVHNHSRASALIKEALAEFPGDPELTAVATQIEQAEARANDAANKSEQARKLYEAGDASSAIDLLREANQAAPQNASIRAALIEVLLREAGSKIDRDWAAAEPLVTETLSLDPGSPLARSLETLIRDRRQSGEVSTGLTKARNLQASGEIRDALGEINTLLHKYPRENRLIQFRTTLIESLSPEGRAELRSADLEEVKRLAEQSKATSDPQVLDSIFLRTQRYSEYGEDAAFRDPLSAIEERHATKSAPVPRPELPPFPPFQEPRAAEPPPTVLSPDGTADIPEFVGDPTKGGRLKVAVAGAAMFLLTCLVLLGVQWYSKSSTNSGGSDALSAAGVQKVLVSGTEPNQFKIYDGGGTDVTTQYSVGFGAGDYRLAASKPGFEPFEARFTIDPGKLPPSEIVVKWVALPTEVTIKLDSRSGVVSVDGVVQQLDAAQEIRAQWKNGNHTFVWNRNADSLLVRFEVKDDLVTMTTDPLKGGNVTGLVVVYARGEMSFQSINAGPGVMKKIGDIESPPALSGTFPFPIGSSVSFKTKSGTYPMGEYTAPANGRSAVFVRVVPGVQRSYVNPSTTPSGVQPAPQTNTAQPSAAGTETPSEAELRKLEYEKKLRQAFGAGVKK